MDIPPDFKDRLAALERQFAHVPIPIMSLLVMLPAPGDEFAAEERVNFLRALASVCDVIYGQDGRIEVEMLMKDQCRD